MCGRFLTKADKRELAARLALVDPAGEPDLAPNSDLPPSRPAYVIGAAEGNARKLTAMSWGLVPRWWKRDLKECKRPSNAMAETVHEKPFFRDSFARRRCLVPVAGFYEWRDEGEGRPKTRFLFRPADGELLVLGGVWDEWAPAGRDPMKTFAVITTEPNGVTAAVHNRMPVILGRESWNAWLDPKVGCEEARLFLGPCPDEWLVAEAVGQSKGKMAGAKAPRKARGGDTPSLFEAA